MGSALQDTSGAVPSPENARKVIARSAHLFRGLRKLGMLFDILAIFAAFALAVQIQWHTPLASTPWSWRDGVLSNFSSGKLMAAFCGFALVLLWISSHHHEPGLRRRGLFQEQKLNLQDCAIAGIFLLSALYLMGVETLPRGFVLFFLVLVALGLGIRRLIYRTFPAEPTGRRNVLIIGTNSTACALREQLREDPGLGYAFKGFVKLSDSEPVRDPAELVGTIDKLAEHVCNYSINELLLTASCDRKATLKLVRQARELGITVRMAPGHLRFAVDQKNRSRL